MRLSAILFLILSFADAESAVLSATNRNLVLITIDTLRADYLGVNGATRVRTPNLDGLARLGVNFTRARSPVPLTLPAHASILTGQYPPTHGVRDNGSFQLGEEHTTLAELLSREGYQTAAFIGSFVLDRRFGLLQGFDTYDDRVWSQVGDLETLTAERTGESVLESFQAWISRPERSRPFFAWLHLYDPHAPYEPPEPFRSSYPDNPYAGEVAYTDQVIGRVVERLAEHDTPSGTLVAVVGDHGEGLGEHGESTHSLLIYNSTLHVPMLLYGPGLVPQGRVVDDLVRVIDLAPTLLDLLEIEVEMGEGVSLRSRFSDSLTRTSPLTAYSESFYPQLQLGWSPLRGLEAGDERLILAPTPELYDVRRDPEEKRNLASTEASAFQRLKRELVQQLATFEEADSENPMTPDPESQAKLRSLGYLSGGSRGSGWREGPLIDPKDRLDEWQRIQLGVARFNAGDYRGAVQSFEAVLKRDPEILMAYEYLGRSWQQLANQERAEEVYRAALDRELESAELHLSLGRLYREQGDLDRAEKELEISVVLDPRNVQARFELGQTHRQAGRLGQAIEHYRAAVDLNPDYLWAWNGLGMSLASRDESQEALGAFERVVEIDPQGAAGYFNLAVHLESSNLQTRAIKAYERFLKLSEGEDWKMQRQRAIEAIGRLAG